jgi:hypothetical protein
LATPPKRVNAGERTTVTGTQVINADDRDVEREHLNRILKALNARIEAAEGNNNGGGGSSGGVKIHGLLQGLGADDHELYHTDYRAFVWLLATLIPQSGVDIEGDATVPSIDLYILTTTGTAAEALSAGEFVNFEETTGEVLLADGSTNDRPADGFVLDDYTLGATDVRVYYGAENNALSGLTVGHIYYLSATVPGGVISVPPGDASPVVVQQLGRAISSTSMLVNIQSAIERPVEN